VEAGPPDVNQNIHVPLDCLQLPRTAPFDQLASTTVWD
jgi:hypothetical protein